MSGKYKLEIEESLVTLKDRMKRAKTASDKERIQMLYLLKSGKAQTVTEASELIGRNRVTVQKWMRSYREGGIKGILAHKHGQGRKSKLPPWAEKSLDQKLHEEEGFRSYGEIQEWLEQKLGIIASYKLVHGWVKYRLKASLKVPRPLSEKQSRAQVKAYKKTWGRI
jgi:transposase